MSERALANGVLQGYHSFEDTLFGVKGRIDMPAQLARRAGLALPVEVQYDEYTTDIVENRLLHGAVAQLLRLPGLPAVLIRRLRHLAARLVDVGAEPAQRTPPSVEYT